MVKSSSWQITIKKRREPTFWGGIFWVKNICPLKVTLLSSTTWWLRVLFNKISSRFAIKHAGLPALPVVTHTPKPNVTRPEIFATVSFQLSSAFFGPKLAVCLGENVEIKVKNSGEKNLHSINQLPKMKKRVAVKVPKTFGTWVTMFLPRKK